MSEQRAAALSNSPRALALLLALVASIAASNLTTYFSLPLALAKLCLGLFGLTVIGAMCAQSLGLGRPRLLASAWYLLLAQVLCVTYVYLRSALSLGTGLPGITLPEVVVALSLLMAHFARRHGLPRLLGRASAVDLACHVLWLAGFFAIASQKLDLLYTPSSDPDFHAWHARQILEHGQLYSNLLPQSDVPLTYAGAFASLNVALSRLSGLHPVQLVNLQPYLQQAIFAGCGFSLLAQQLKRRSSLLLFGLLYFAASGLVFNPVFVNGRAHLEGTARLSHTALLFFPLFFALWNGNRVARRPILLLLPTSAVMIGVCTNPAHAPASLLLAAIAAALALLRWRSGGMRIAATRRSWITSALACGVLAGLFLWVDPFYRDAAGFGAPRDAATDTATNAFALHLDGAQIAAALPKVLSEFAAPWQSPDIPTPLPLALWSAALSCALLVAAGMIPALRRQLALSPGNKRIVALFAGAVAFLLLHGLWCELVPSFVRFGHVAGRLLVQYSWGAQRQTGLLFFALLAPLPLLLALAQLERFADARAPTSSSTRARTKARGVALASVVMIGLAALPFYRLAAARVETFLPELRTTPLGEVYADDLRIASVAEAQVAEEERVLLPGRLLDKRYERWVLPTGGARAIPHFTDLRTAFFAGHDGTAFSVEAYAKHVRLHFDSEWLRAHRVVWLLDNGELPRTLLERHYEAVAQGEHSSLWKLR
jgi:hypothetical protein